MNEQDKQLLLKDLCARLPYGVKVYCEDFSRCEFLTIRNISCYEIHFEEQGGQFSYISKIKPYLRPLNTITDTEVSRAIGIITGGVSRWSEEDKRWYYIVHDPSIGEIENDFDLDYFAHGYYGIDNVDFLDSHHFDYRGLIEKGLALEAPEDMY